jgi:hypothetical protein
MGNLNQRLNKKKLITASANATAKLIQPPGQKNQPEWLE